MEGKCIDFGIPMQRELCVFLEECMQPRLVQPIQLTICPEDFIETVKAWKDSTSTSPSGRHLGHYRTAVLDNNITLTIMLLNSILSY